MAKLTIIRPYEWANQQKNTDVYIDGKRVGSVGINQTVQFDLTPGKHTVELRQRWLSGGSKPLEVNLSDNKNTTIKMKSYKYNWLAFFIFFPLIISTYLTLSTSHSFMVKFVGGLLVLGLIYLFIYMLFLRTRFLEIEEVEL